MKNTVIVTIVTGLICLSAYMIHAMEEPAQPTQKQSEEALAKVSPEELESAIPEIGAFQKREAALAGVSRDTSQLIVAQLISIIMYKELSEAKKDFPDTPEAELRADIIASIKRVLLAPGKTTPSVVTLPVEQLEAPEPVAVSEQAPAQPVPAGKDYSLTGWLKWLVGAK